MDPTGAPSSPGGAGPSASTISTAIVAVLALTILINGTIFVNAELLEVRSGDLLGPWVRQRVDQELKASENVLGTTVSPSLLLLN
jgi:hypothetical protein